MTNLNLNLNNCFYFNRELYHFHFCRQADCFVRMLHIYKAIHPMTYERNMEGITPNYDETLVTEFLS